MKRPAIIRIATRPRTSEVGVTKSRKALERKCAPTATDRALVHLARPRERGRWGDSKRIAPGLEPLLRVLFEIVVAHFACFGTSSAIWICLLLGCMGTETDNPAAPEGLPKGADFIRSSLSYIEQVEVSISDQQALSDGNLRFTSDLYRTVVTLAVPEQNLCISPYGITAAMGMLYAGARGQSEQQIAAALHFVLDKTALYPAINKMRQEVHRHPDDATTRLVDIDALFFERGNDYRPQFLDTLSQYYDTGVYALDMAADPFNAKSSINRWIADQTDDAIPALFDADTALSTMVLANVIYLESPWAQRFAEEKTEAAVFTNLDGSQAMVDMMRMQAPTTASTETSPFDKWMPIYIEDDEAQVIAIAYQDLNIRLLVMLPRQGSFDIYEQNLDAEKISEVIARLRKPTYRNQTVEIALPKFYFDNSHNLKQVLSALGMTQPFETGQADFSGVNRSSDLYLEMVVHRTFIGIDESGTEAAQASEWNSPNGTVDASFVADRPFIFLVWDELARQTLFIGRVVQLGNVGSSN